MDLIEKVVNVKIGDASRFVVREAAALLGVSNFCEARSSNMTKIRMRNCIIETTASEIYVRSGTPEDYVSISTNIDYPFNMKYESIEVRERETWCKQTFGSDSLSEAMQVDMASFARGGNVEKLFRAWIGVVGNNSKSMHVECLGLAYGQYLKHIPTAALSGKASGQGAHTAELTRTEGAFIVIVSEPEANEYVHGGRVKGYTSGIDRLYIRGLYEDGREMAISWKLLLMSNHDIPIGQGGRALDDRMMISPFDSRWSYNPPSNGERQMTERHFKLDKSFSDKLHGMAQAYWFLTVNKYYNMYVKQGTGPRIHETILSRTTTFNRSNNLVLSFWDECVHFVRKDNGEPDLSFTVTCEQIYGPFKDFCRLRDIKQNHQLDIDLFSTSFFVEATDHSVPVIGFSKNFAKREYGGIKISMVAQNQLRPPQQQQ
jgi:phage/plasmid-associated DNA primase